MGFAFLCPVRTPHAGGLAVVPSRCTNFIGTAALASTDPKRASTAKGRGKLEKKDPKERLQRAEGS